MTNRKTIHNDLIYSVLLKDFILNIHGLAYHGVLLSCVEKEQQTFSCIQNHTVSFIKSQHYRDNYTGGEFYVRFFNKMWG